MKLLTQHAGDLLDYRMNWADWLTDGETIATSEWFLPAGLELSASSKTDDTTTVWVEGGQPSTTYKLRNRITTSGNRVRSQSFLLRIEG